MKKTATVKKQITKVKKIIVSSYKSLKTNVQARLKTRKFSNRSKKFKKSLPFSRYTLIIFATLIASVMQLNGLVGAIQGEPDTKGVKAVSVQKDVTPPANTQNINEPFTPERIIIKEKGIDLPVVSVPLENGTWQVNAGVANYAEGTSLINTHDGNVGIFAHDRKDAFSSIKQLLTGSDIIVLGKNKRATYKVHSASVIAPTAVNVFFPTEEPTLTLITCDGVFSEKRYMVKAELVKVEFIK